MSENNPQENVLYSINPSSVIDKSSPVPLHHQLEQFLRKGIASGLFPANETLPTEKELQDHFDLSRTPVRQAIGKLVNDGLVMRRRSLGTIVLPKPFEENLTSLSTFTEEVMSRGQTPTAELLDFRIDVPSAEVMHELNIDANTKVFEILRLRRIDGEPAGLIRSFLPVEAAPYLQHSDFASEGPNQSFYRLLADKYDIKLTQAVETFKAVVVDSELSRHLESPKGSAVLLRSRLAFDHQEHPIAFENGYYRFVYRIKWRGHEVMQVDTSVSEETI